MSDEGDRISDVEISCKGIDLMVNNDWDGCEKLYSQYKDVSPLTNYCYSFISYMRAVMTFEDPLLEKAQKDIENTEKLCSESTKMFSSFKKAFGISSSSSSNSLKGDSKNKEISLEDKFTKAIILADCKLYLAILTFVRQEVSAYLSSGILQIRKSWKMYAKIQKQLYDLYKKLEPNAENIYGSDPNSNTIQLWIEEDDESTDPKSKSNGETADAINDLNISDENIEGMSLEAVKRLLGAVSFGYGLFQICLSFMPPNALKLIKVFGFEGDRNVAIKAINFTSNSKDMRAPFADMVLVWYAAIATPLFGVSEADVTISDEDTRLILEKNLNKYPNSSLFLYLKGKYQRTSLRDVAGSLACFEQSAKNSSHIREIQLISIYEIGWINLSNFEYKKALEQFQTLHKDSKWSRSFSTYICAILHGSLEDYSKANECVKEALKIISNQSRKSNPIEVFALKRNEYFKKHPIKSKAICELLVVELLYLWACIQFCEEKHLKKILEICDNVTEKNFVALKCLFEGVTHMNLKNFEFGEQCLNEAVARAENEKHPPFGKYVLPCTHYELAVYYTNEKDYTSAKSHVAKARDNYKDYELENRVQTQLKSLQRRIKYQLDKPRLEAKLKEDQEQKNQKQAQLNNFYVQ